MTTQILLNYEHPHIKTVINDNTAVSEVLTEVTSGVRFLNVFTSKKGRDGVFLKFNDENAFIEEYGTPNFHQHGQPIYNALASLKTRNAECYCMRVMPEDAAYSNLLVSVKYKIDNETDPDNPVMLLKHEFSTQDGLVDKTNIDSVVDKIGSEDPDADGYITLPLMGFYSLGRGEYGNGFRVRLSNIISKNKRQLNKTYRLEVLDTENGLERKEMFEASLYDAAVYKNNSLFYEDVVNDDSKGSTKINMYVNPYAVEYLYDIYKTEIDPETTVDIRMFDVLFGVTAQNNPIKGLERQTNFDGFIAVDRVEGINLNGGTDGTLTVAPVSMFNVLSSPRMSEDRETALNNLYLKAFKGEINKAILSKRRTPARFILDAGYSEEVKKEMVNLALKRYDAHLHLDAGLLYNVEEAIGWGQMMSAEVTDRIVSKNFQHYQIKDPYNGKKIPVTVTYFLASVLPKHISNIGDHIPVTGENYAKLNNIVKNSLMPFIDADELDLKEELYDLRLNYFECLQENTFVRGTQQTAQEEETDLSEEHNVYMLLEMKRIVENRVSSMIYDFGEADDRVRFQQDCDNALKSYRHKVKSYEVEFTTTPYETERGILHCRLAVVYKTINKRGIIEIDINKRTLV